ncbi:MAG: ActR/PrrA/RegA family redox response regulator transcription factor [Alphaproteobacteria bacterium]
MGIQLKAPSQDNVVVIVDDEISFANRMGRALERIGFQVEVAGNTQDARGIIESKTPKYAVFDMRLPDGNGLDLVKQLNERRPDASIVVLTGFGNLTTAVTSVKLGAKDYLAKPSDADDVARVLLSQTDELPEPPEQPMSADRVRWEHIQRVFEQCNRNVSETARRLAMHRRTLQRILAKRSPR